MKAIIFAGGVGTRLWPISRRNSPKQFEKVFGDKSTLQLAVDRIKVDFKLSDIYISTNNKYKEIIEKQIPGINKKNIIGEPDNRDVGPAVALAISIVKKNFPDEKIVILWSDHLIKNEDKFRKAISAGGKSLGCSNTKIIFITQEPRFPNQNLGWVKRGKCKTCIENNNLYNFDKFKYRPETDEAVKYFNNNDYSWFIGYFVSSVDYLWNSFKSSSKEIFSFMENVLNIKEKNKCDKYILENYHKLPKISFDNVVLEHIEARDALVIVEDFGWSDVGSWEALKEALQSTKNDNIIQGKVLVEGCSDSLIYNYTEKLVVAVDLESKIVINTNDAVMISSTHSTSKIKKIVEGLIGSENENLA